MRGTIPIVLLLLLLTGCDPFLANPEVIEARAAAEVAVINAENAAADRNHAAYLALSEEDKNRLFECVWRSGDDTIRYQVYNCKRLMGL